MRDMSEIGLPTTPKNLNKKKKDSDEEPPPCFEVA